MGIFHESMNAIRKHAREGKWDDLNTELAKRRFDLNEMGGSLYKVRKHINTYQEHLDQAIAAANTKDAKGVIKNVDRCTLELGYLKRDLKHMLKEELKLE